MLPQMLHGANLIPETLETGEYKIANTTGFSELEPLYVIAYGQKDLTWDGSTYTFTGGFVNGVFSGILFCIGDSDFMFNFYPYLKNNALDINIITAFTIPKLACPYVDGTTHHYLIVAGSYNAAKVTKTLSSTPTSLDGYQPRNKKLLQYPYTYLGFNPPNGSAKVYRYEDFTNGTPVFDIMSEINPDPTVYFIPKNYRGQVNNLNDSVSMNGYPTISFTTDYFNSYLAQNLPGMAINLNQRSHNALTQNTQTAISAAAGFTNNLDYNSDETVSVGQAGAANIANSILSMYSNAKNFDYYQQAMMAEIEKNQLIPDNATLGSTNATLIGYSMFANENVFTRYTIKRQFAERLDKYFDQFGYLTNTLKIPNINNRPSWNYVKTAGFNAIGDVPEADMQEIKALFNEGITLWHDPTTFLNYSGTNR